MNRNFLILFSLFITVSAPLIVTAEVFLTKSFASKNEVKNEQIKMTTEAKLNKNRIERIENVINALRVSINLTEGSASKIELRIKGLDANDNNVVSANTELQNARIKLIESKKIIKKAKDFTYDMDTRNQKDIEEIKSLLTSTEKSINESIQILKSAANTIRSVKITR